ncbi:MAG: adenylate/guanylate cyclase domain-containing protein [Legionellaceae bacterium]|nr:adenylate/guanylate cyclase domain-containing protein [Legionellaceae bacterium]
MKGPDKLQKLVPFMPFVVSVILMAGALWIALSPYQPGAFIAVPQEVCKRLDYIRYDMKGRWFSNQSSKNHTIIVVDIDSKSILQEGVWPWRYERIIALLKHLHEEDVSAIVLDGILGREEKNIIKHLREKLVQENVGHVVSSEQLKQLEVSFDENRRLVQYISDNPNIVLPFLLSRTPHTQGALPKPFMTLSDEALNTSSILNLPGYLTSFDALQRALTHTGFILTQGEWDGITRQQLLIARHGNRVYLSLPLAVASSLYPEKKVHIRTVNWFGSEYIASIQFGDKLISTDKNARIWIPGYKGGANIRHVSAVDVLSGKVSKGTLKSAVVFLGPTISGLQDIDNKQYASALLSNIEIQATVLDSILNKRFLYTPYWNKTFEVVAILCVGTITGLVFSFLSVGIAISIAFLLQLTLLVINTSFFLNYGMVFSLAAPLLLGALVLVTSTALAFLFERGRKAYLRRAFAQYVPPDYLKLLMDNPSAYGFEGKSVELTVLFADIRHFTTISEHLSASDVKKMLNKFFTPMTEVILRHGGTIDKYVGDMVMAFWGAPIENALHAEAAINASLEMLDKTAALQKKFHEARLPEITLGIGLNTGLMNVGDMGSKFRRSYTVIGDAVNLASRLQSATTYYGVSLLVGHATQVSQTQFVFRMVDSVKFKGKHDAEKIYEVICRKSDLTVALSEELAAHEKALAAYFAKDFALASTLFKALTKRYPNTQLYAVFLARIAQFEQHPPRPGWDGVYVFNEK